MPAGRVRDLYLIPVAGNWNRRACPICQETMPPALRGSWARHADQRRRRPKRWALRARAYHHPNPHRSTLILWRCWRHATVRTVPFQAKEGLGGGVYR